MNTKLMFSSKTDDWATPQEFFDKLNEEFCFDLDPCADKHNHKCETYFTKEMNGLEQSWGGVLRILQPSLWKRNRKMGGKSRHRSKETKHNGRYAYSGKNRHYLFS